MSTLKVDTISEKTTSGGITFSQDITATLSSSSNVKAPLNASGSAPVYACRAWVNFDGTTNTGGFCDIRASGNVSSVADNGTGDYTVNFTTAMPDANYAFTVSTGSTGYGMCANNPQVTGSFRLFTVSSAAADTDFSQIAVSIFR